MKYCKKVLSISLVYHVYDPKIELGLNTTNFYLKYI